MPVPLREGTRDGVLCEAAVRLVGIIQHCTCRMRVKGFEMGIRTKKAAMASVDEFSPVA